MNDTKTRSPTRLSGLTTLIANGKWAILPGQLRDIVSGFNAYLAGGSVSEQITAQVREVRTRQAETLQQNQEQAPGVAIISLYGTIFPRGSLMVDLCGAVDAHTLAARIREAADHPNVASIVLDVDSGGGAVSGVDVAAEAVRYAAGKKRITALANTTMCSAAFWIASGATEIVATPAAEVGSIGVIGTHTDESAALDEQGLKVTYVRSTPGKALGQSAEAMEGDVLASWQDEIGRLHTLFIDQIALGRAVSVAKARAWATGKVWFGEEAVTDGLVDSVGTLDSVLADHLTAIQPPVPVTQGARKGQAEVPDLAPEETPMKLELKDRTGQIHTIDTENGDVAASAQALVTTAENNAFKAGLESTRDVVAQGLGIEPNEVKAETLARLQAQAADGRAYRADLEARVETLAVSVYGPDSKSAATHANLAKKADLADLRDLVDDLETRKAAMFPGGRQSKDLPAEKLGEGEAGGEEKEVQVKKPDPALFG